MSVTPATRRKVIARAEGTCEGCDGVRGWRGFEVHHRQSRRFGNHSPENLLFLCAPCHQWATEHPAAARCLGWSVRMSEDPGSVRCALVVGEVWLSSDGQYLPVVQDQEAQR